MQSCLLVGMSGAGKSSTYKCVTSFGPGGQAGLTKATKVLTQAVMTSNSHSLSLYDTVGFEGVEMSDLQTFQKTIDDLSKVRAYINRVIWCFDIERNRHRLDQVHQR